MKKRKVATIKSADILLLYEKLRKKCRRRARWVFNSHALEDLREGRPDPELAKYDGIEGYAVGKEIR